jgi:outer membrane lipoprotein-sorting protein
VRATTWLFFLIIGLAGCATVDRTTRERNLPIDEVLKRVHERNNTIQTLKGDGTITFESPELSNRGSFDLVLKKPDSLRIEFGGPFGIHVGTLFFSKEKFLFYNSLENRIVKGTPNDSSLKSLFQLKMNFDEMLRAFTGEFPINTIADTLFDYKIDDNQYIIKYRNDSSTIEYHIDCDAFIITAYHVVDGNGEVTLNAFSSRIENQDEIPMPALIRVIFPKERRSITIAYDDLEINKQVDCSYTPPPQTRTTPQ